MIYIQSNPDNGEGISANAGFNQDACYLLSIDQDIVGRLDGASGNAKTLDRLHKGDCRERRQ